MLLGDLLRRSHVRRIVIDDERLRFPAARAVLVLGALGLPLLILGQLMYSTQLCLIGAVLAGAAAVLHVVLLLAGR